MRATVQTSINTRGSLTIFEVLMVLHVCAVCTWTCLESVLMEEVLVERRPDDAVDAPPYRSQTRGHAASPVEVLIHYHHGWDETERSAYTCRSSS